MGTLGGGMQLLPNPLPPRQGTHLQSVSTSFSPHIAHPSSCLSKLGGGQRLAKLFGPDVGNMFVLLPELEIESNVSQKKKKNPLTQKFPSWCLLPCKERKKKGKEVIDRTM